MSERLTDEQVCPGCQRWVDEGRPPNGGCPDHGRRAVPWTYPVENEVPKRLTDEQLIGVQVALHRNFARVLMDTESRAALDNAALAATEALERGREVRDRDRRYDNLRRELNDVAAAAQQQEQAYNVALRERDEARVKVAQYAVELGLVRAECDRLRAQVEALVKFVRYVSNVGHCEPNTDHYNDDTEALEDLARLADAALTAAQDAPLAEGEG